MILYLATNLCIASATRFCRHFFSRNCWKARRRLSYEEEDENYELMLYFRFILACSYYDMKFILEHEFVFLDPKKGRRSS